MSSVIRDTERSPGAVAALEWPCWVNLMCMHMRVYSKLCARVRKMRKIVVRFVAEPCSIVQVETPGRVCLLLGCLP